MLVLAAMLMGVVLSGAMQEAGASSSALPIAAQQEQQGAPPVVSRDTVPSGPAPAQTPKADDKQVVTIPAGTRIPLTLANPIKPKAARRGDSVRAVTAFPVAVDAQVAIPAGVYVEGVIDKLLKKDRWGHPGFEVHFTRMVFPNGYVLQLEAESEQARAGEPSESESADSQEVSNEHGDGPSAEDAFQFPQQPPPPTLPPLPKPNYGPAIGLGVGGAAAAVAILIIATHHRYDYFRYEVGWQFDMVLQSPLKVDAANWSADVGN